LLAESGVKHHNPIVAYSPPISQINKFIWLLDSKDKLLIITIFKLLIALDMERE
jgi:hypothetical protein